MIGDVIVGCQVEWKEQIGPGSQQRRLASVTVKHVAKNMCEFERPRSGRVVRKRLTGANLDIKCRNGVDVRWKWICDDGNIEKSWASREYSAKRTAAAAAKRQADWEHERFIRMAMYGLEE